MFYGTTLSSKTLPKPPITETPSTEKTCTSSSGASALYDDESLDESLLSEFATHLFADRSLFNGDGRIKGIISDSLTIEGEEKGAVLLYGVQNLSHDEDKKNPLSCQYLGYDLALTDHEEKSSLLVLTFCPPTEVELSSPHRAEFISFDLGFSVMELNNHAYVASLLENSPAMRVGVRQLFKIKYAFSHTLSSYFRNQVDDLSLSFIGSITFLLNSHPEVAVYHVGEQETRAAAAYALSCVENGCRTTFQSFIAMFPFDITKPPDSYKPAKFVQGQDPILYPITVVFEKETDLRNNLSLQRILCSLDGGGTEEFDD
jgi:hypothetical protein